MLASCGKLFEDWSADYRLFQKQRMDVDKLFDTVRKKTVALDCKRSGPCPYRRYPVEKDRKKIPGTAWRRDPLGPPFHTNFIWGKRFIQISVSLPEGRMPCSNRSIPVDIFHSPIVKKPKKSDTVDEWEDYREKQKTAKLSVRGAERIGLLRKKLDKDGAGERPLIVMRAAVIPMSRS